MGTVSEGDGRISRDGRRGRGSYFAGCSSAGGNSVAGFDVDSDGGKGGGRGGLVEKGGTSCGGNGRTGIAGNTGGLSEANPPLSREGVRYPYLNLCYSSHVDSPSPCPSEFV